VTYKLSELINIQNLHKIMYTIYEITGMPYSITDNEGNILSKAGRQDICDKFHQKCPQTKQKCRESDNYLFGQLNKGPYLGYKCPNGMINYATPVIIDGRHMAVIKMGQLFHDPPDKEYFRSQARQYGFDEKEYLAALYRVPIISKYRAKTIMIFYSQLAQVMGESGLQRIGQLKEKEKLLHLSEDRFAKIFRASPNIISVATLQEGRFLDINDSFLNSLGYSRGEVIGCTIEDLDIIADIPTHKSMCRLITENKSIHNMEVKLRCKSGNIITGLLSTEIIEVDGQNCLLGIVNDITKRRQMEKKLQRLEQLNLIGRMAASISHEIRNPLTTVRGFLQILMEKGRYKQEREYFELMIEELDRANSIVTEYLTLSKNKAAELKAQNLNQSVNALLPLIRADAVNNEKAIYTNLAEVPDILMDENEIRQLILNLVRNGLEAMPPGGVLKISTYLDNEEIVLAVQDQGAGIRPEIMDKIGTPFFTTKKSGTGLGLAVCYSIAAKHNADIQIDTGSAGTTFFVRFKTRHPVK
jgi:two-component system, sporulation sensor kinase E